MSQLTTPPRLTPPGGFGSRRRTRIANHLPALVPGLIVVGLFIVWGVHDGGYGDDTWYWGALVVLAVLGAVLVLLGPRRIRPARPATIAIGCFALYVAWSYLSIAWAQAPGVALNGSNRALLYLLVFTLFAVLPWTAEAALLALTVFAVGVGAIAIILIVRFAAIDHLPALIVQGRLAAPIGYFNGTAALFTMHALTAVGLASRRELPGLLRGLLVALAGASLDLAVIVQSRGWLFTLPLVLIIAAIVMPDRLRFAAAAVIPALMVLVPIHRLLAIYDSAQGPRFGDAAAQAGREGLVLIGGAFVVGTVLAWFDGLRRGPTLTTNVRRVLGGIIVAVALAGAVAGGLAVSHGHPLQFISRQWRGFSHEQSASTGSHFTDLGSSRYDFWRVAVDAFLAHPVGGLGQDNFRDYYLPRRHTTEDPAWTHSLELRLLAQTGLVGAALFVAALVCALIAAVRSRRRAPPAASAAAASALLPLVVWLIHGSLDWFWELPALAAPALGFLGMATSFAGAPARRAAAAPRRDSARPGRPLPALRATGLAAALLAATVVLALSYLAVREVSTASDVGPTQPARALADLADAANLNPLSVDPDRLAGTIALRTGAYRVAAARFRSAVGREPGDWFSWLGAGLAASALHRPRAAERAYRIAHSIEDLQPAVTIGLARALGPRPLTPAQAFSMLVLLR